jgi:hypothetical protein
MLQRCITAIAFIALLFLSVGVKAQAYHYYFSNRQSHLLFLNITKELPRSVVEEVPIKGNQQSKAIELQVNLTESDLMQIELERSDKAIEFTTIAMLSGPAQIKNRLTFIDNYPLPGYHSYRLKCIRKDGAVSYSSVARVLFTDNALALKSVYPNSAMHDINVR